MAHFTAPVFPHCHRCGGGGGGGQLQPEGLHFIRHGEGGGRGYAGSGAAMYMCMTHICTCMYVHVHTCIQHMHLRAIYVPYHHHFYTHIAFCAQNTCSKGTRTVMRTSMCKAYCTFSFPSSFHLLFAGLDQLIGSCKKHTSAYGTCDTTYMYITTQVHVLLLHVHHNTSTCITTTCTSQHKYMYYYYMYITTQVHVLLLHVHHNTSTCITTTCTSQHKYM